jgi:para-nitrobenzyl esterase
MRRTLAQAGLGFFATLCLSAWALTAAAAPVATESGAVDGTVEDGLSVYRGIPFAAPPVGPLRWREPQPAAHWDGVRTADKFGAPCMGNGPASSEDCLYLNVWSPAKSPKAKLPVMVWIYGGGFVGGATSTPLYSGEMLASHGVVFISIAYRTGVMGFLAHPALSAEDPHHVSGNYGLEDQIAGLKWVKRNIAAFGGDPRRVTIFGESAGGISVSMLAASPLAKGLFEGAMSESGGSFAPPRDPPLPGENVERLKDAEREGAAMGDALGAHTAADLRALSPDALAKAAGGGPPGSAAQATGAWPVLDGYVIAGDQYKLYVEGRYNRTPILIGINSDEGVSFNAPPTLKPYLEQTRARYGPFAERLLAAYPADSDATAKQAARDLTRDAAFGWHNWVWARLQGRSEGPKVYYYYFEQRAPYPPASRYADVKGVPHGAELPFVFGHMAPPSGAAPAPGAVIWRPEDVALSDQVETYWTNFVKTGDPNGPGLPGWPAYSATRPDVMHLHAHPAAGPVPNPQQLKVLDQYFAWRRTQP